MPVFIYKMRIRPAISADIPVLMALEKCAVTASHWSAEQYQAVFSNPGISRIALVIEQESRVEGFLIARAVRPEWEIENLAVAGPARRRGHGTRLLGEFLDMARNQGAEAVFLEVRESNLAARRLYEKWAFVESGVRRRYYHDPLEDAVAYRFTFS
ncbi:MAG: ribosomal protein S18-alanine N-acetyltransferase [Terriglobales bacterium]